MKPFARIVLSPVLAVLTGSCRVMFRMAVIVGLLCNGCATIPEHPSTSIGKCAQDMRIFDVRLADKVVDATSYEEVEGILGLPTNNFGSGIVHNQWVFDNGEVYEINSLSVSGQQGKKQPVGIMFPCWRVKRQKANADTGKCRYWQVRGCDGGNHKREASEHVIQNRCLACGSSKCFSVG